MLERTAGIVRGKSAPLLFADTLGATIEAMVQITLLPFLRPGESEDVQERPIVNSLFVAPSLDRREQRR